MCFETSFNEAISRKTLTYIDLMEEAQTKGYNAQILTLEVGSHGILNLDGFMYLRELLKTSRRDFTNFLTVLARTSISQSHKIWCLRNWTDQ